MPNPPRTVLKRARTTTLSLLVLAAFLATGLDARELEALTLPVRFEKNQGQFPGGFHYAARIRGGTAFVAEDGLAFSPDAGDGAMADLRFIGANAHPKIHSLHELRVRSNYFRGQEPDGWIERAPSFERVRYDDLYDGVHLELYGTGSSVEFDLIVEPGADPEQIQFEWSENAKPKIEQGDLVVTIGRAELRLHTPITYQLNAAGEQERVKSRYRRNGNSFRFDLAAFDPERTLVVDPVITFSSLVGGNAIDEIAAVKTDADGNVYMAGQTTSTSFLGVERTGRDFDLFVIKLSPALDILFVTIFGGSDASQKLMDLTIDEHGRAVVTGATTALDFPLVTPVQPSYGGTLDAFVARFDTQGNLEYATYLGGAAVDGDGARLTIDGEGAIYVCFSTFSRGLSLVNPVQAEMHGNDDLLLVKLSPDGDRILFSTYLGGTGAVPVIPNERTHSVLADSAGDVFLVGYTFSTDFPIERPIQSQHAGGTDLFITKISGADGSILFSTFFGGSGIEVERGTSAFTAELDPSGDLWLAFTTESNDLPLVAPTHSEPTSFFLAKIQGDGSAIVLSTYLPASSGISRIHDLAVSPDGTIFVAGVAAATDLPLLDEIPMAVGRGDGFIMRVNREGTVISATYLGGSGGDTVSSICTDRRGLVYVAGTTSSTDMPLVAPFHSTLALPDGFLVKLSYAPPGSGGRRRAVAHGQ